MNNPNKTASPQGPDPEAPDGLNAPTPDPGELSPNLYPETRLPDAQNLRPQPIGGQGLGTQDPGARHPDDLPQTGTEQPEKQQSATQNPMTPSDPGPDRRTPTGPLPEKRGPNDPIPDRWTADPNRDPDNVEIPSKPEIPPKPRRDVPHTDLVRASQTAQPSKKDSSRVVGTKPTTKAARSKREVKQPPPTQHR